MDEQTELAVAEPVAVANLFGAADPAAVVGQATVVADALKSVLKEQKLVVNMGRGNEHVTIEGWTLLGSMLGVFPVTVATEALTDAEGELLGFTAHVEARTRDGSVVGAASARCMKTEKNWGNRDDYALESMAQTRASSKALRMPLGFIVTLAGYSGTPAEEMPNYAEVVAQPVLATPVQKDQANADGEVLITTEQMAALGRIAEKHSWELQDVMDVALQTYPDITKLSDLTADQGAEMIRTLQQRETADA